MNDWFVGAAGVIVAVMILLVGFEMGRDVVKDNCETYGKAKVKKTILICSVQKP